MEDLKTIACEDVKWRKVKEDGLNLDYTVLIPKNTAYKLLETFEKSLKYFEGDLAKVKVFGKWHPIPRQQVAFGDDGISYRFSGLTIPALKWTPELFAVKQKLHELTGHDFNFVLINRYRDGNDHIGEHRDDESELDQTAPIASISLGQTRTFVLRHRDARGNGPYKRDVPTVKLDLEHGSLLLMNHPTNKFWYHSIPVKKTAIGVRINLTFRKFNKSAQTNAEKS